MGGSLGNSASQAADYRAAASDEAVLYNLAGSKGGQIGGARFENIKGGLTVQSTDLGAVQSAFDFAGGLANQVSGLIAGSFDTNAQAISANNALLSESLAGFRTGGGTDNSKTFLYLGLAAVAIVALLFFWRR